MNAASIVAMVGALTDAVREAPAVILAIEEVFATLRTGDDVTPAVKHLEAVAAAHALDINDMGL
jgi:hypothetical protein